METLSHSLSLSLSLSLCPYQFFVSLPFCVSILCCISLSLFYELLKSILSSLSLSVCFFSYPVFITFSFSLSLTLFLFFFLWVSLHLFLFFSFICIYFTSASLMNFFSLSILLLSCFLLVFTFIFYLLRSTFSLLQIILSVFQSNCFSLSPKNCKMNPNVWTKYLNCLTGDHLQSGHTIENPLPMSNDRNGAETGSYKLKKSLNLVQNIQN